MEQIRKQIANPAWRAYRSELYRFVRARVFDPSLAEDIVHDVLLKAYARRDTLRDPHRLRSWLYQITRNAIVDHYRAKRPLEPLPEDLAGENDCHDDTAERALARCLLPLIKALPRPYRRALWLAEFKGLTQRAVASALGLSLSGAKSRIQRARKMVADTVLGCCKVEFDRRRGVIGYEPRGGCRHC